MRPWLIFAIAAAALSQGLAQTKPPASAPTARKTALPAAKASNNVPSKAARQTPSETARQAPSEVAPKAPSKDEQQIFDSANRERAARQLPALQWNAALASAARAHAQKMAQAGTLSHQFPGEPDMGMRIRLAGVKFTAVAENVAQGPSAAVIHQEWMNSPAHRDNLLDPGLDSLGVAVVERNGELFAVQDFSQASP